MIKFKKITILYLALFAMLSSCNGAMDPQKCLDSVKRVYPNSKIYKDIESNYTFYVLDSSGLRKVTTKNLSNANIDGITELSQIK